MSARIVMEAARDIMLTCDRPKLVEFKGHVQLNCHWAHSLLKRCSTEDSHCQEQTKCCKFQRAGEIVSSRFSHSGHHGRDSSRTHPELGQNGHQNGSLFYLDYGQTECKARSTR